MTVPVLRRNLEVVAAALADACARAGRSRASVRLVAVTKYVSAEVAQQLVELGVTDLGESRPQELWRKAAAVTAPVRWHLVGHLQRNKIDRTLPLVDLVHSVDSERLLTALAAAAAARGQPVRVLLEVHLSGETAKQGFEATELPNLVETIQRWPGLHVQGLMTMAALGADEPTARRTFARLRGLRDELAARLGQPLPELSMGMTQDFAWAIGEGATLVRIGSALFEGLGVEPTA
ncbi:MAG TPA: YggS family pyridoxal phosphate-dependent enzyme [Gemmatales bacterium]|nr:YggS family pyridoxal phosphate-dependent enzyme [Gemmatales bacterium]